MGAIGYEVPPLKPMLTPSFRRTVPSARMSHGSRLRSAHQKSQMHQGIQTPRGKRGPSSSLSSSSSSSSSF
eukprot:12419297-Karenia_brevis.AAC.1